MPDSETTIVLATRNAGKVRELHEPVSYTHLCQPGKTGRLRPAGSPIRSRIGYPDKIITAKKAEHPPFG